MMCMLELLYNIADGYYVYTGASIREEGFRGRDPLIFEGGICISYDPPDFESIPIKK